MNIKIARAAVALAPLWVATAFAQDTPGAPGHDQMHGDQEVYGHEEPTESARKADAQRERAQRQEPVQRAEDAKRDRAQRQEPMQRAEDAKRGRAQRQEPMQRAEDARPTEGNADEPAWKRSAIRESESAWGLSAQAVSLGALSQDQVENLQTELKERGFYRAEVDGIPGRKTKQALREFYDAQARLASRGRIVPAAAERLGLDSQEIQRVSGREDAERETLRGSDPKPRGTTPQAPSSEPDPATTGEKTPAKDDARRTQPDRQTPPEE